VIIRITFIYWLSNITAAILIIGEIEFRNERLFSPLEILHNPLGYS